MKNKRGISLIVLIITIVVIIILAAAIIISLDDNPIDSAEKAVEANDLAALKEAVSIANAQYRLSDKSMTQDEYILDYLDKNKIPHDGYYIENGKLVEGEKEKADIPYDWIDISKSTPKNGIGLLIGSSSYSTTIDFEVTTSGTYSVDWGDGSSATAIASGTAASHTYGTNSSNLSTDGYLFEVKITPDSGYITQFQHIPQSRSDSPLLWCQVGCDTLDSCYFMLDSATKLKKFGTSTDTSLKNVTDTYGMFNGCSSLTTIPKLDTSNVTYMADMFYGCSSLKEIQALNTSKVKNMENMFSGCSSLMTIPQLETSQVTNMNYMFYGCSSLTGILRLDTRNVIYMNGILNGCYSLESINVSNTNLTSAQIDKIFGLLPDLKNTIATIDITGNPGTSGCTRSIATNKHWTITP